MNKYMVPFSVLFYLAAIISCGSSPAPDSTQINYNISDEEFDRMNKKSDNFVILDVRTKDEVANGMIPAAEHLDYYRDDFEEQLKKFDPSSTIIVYCQSGRRAGKTCEKLTSLGYASVFNYGGFERWNP